MDTPLEARRNSYLWWRVHRVHYGRTHKRGGVTLQNCQKEAKMTGTKLARRQLVALVVALLATLAASFGSLTVFADPPVDGWSVFPQSQYGRVWGIAPDGPDGLVGFGTDAGLVTLTPDGVWTLFEREHLTFDVAFWTPASGRVKLCGVQLDLGAYCVDLATGEMSPWYHGITLPEGSAFRDPAELITYVHTVETDQHGNLWLAGLRCKRRMECVDVFVRTNGSWVMLYQEGNPIWVRDASVYDFEPYQDKFLVNTMWGGVLQFDLYRSNFDPNLIYRPDGQHLYSLDMAVQEETGDIIIADLDWLWKGSLLGNREWTSFRPPDFQDWWGDSDQFHRVSFVGGNVWSAIHRTDGTGRLMEYNPIQVWTEIKPPGVTSWAGPTAGPVVDEQGRAWLSWGSMIFMYDPNQ